MGCVCCCISRCCPHCYLAGNRKVMEQSPHNIIVGEEAYRYYLAGNRKVMEQSPHNIIVGEGAQRFAVAQGFKVEEVLTPESAQVYDEWRKDNASGLSV